MSFNKSYINENLLVNNNVTVNNDVIVNGDASLNGNLNMNGDVSFNNGIFVNNLITVSGGIVPTIALTYDIGSVDYPFRDLYFSTGSINFIEAIKMDQIVY